MADLTFTVLGGRAELYAVVPTLVFRVRVTESSGEAIHAIALRAQIQIEPRKRRYSRDEEEPLLDLFGERKRWADTQHPLLWAHVAQMVPGFSGSVDIDVPVLCTYDLEVAAAKYLQALGDGEVPLLFLFSGTIFAKGPGGISVHQVPWDREASYRLPVSAWRDVMDAHFPNSAWIRVRRDTFEALHRYKSLRSLPTWEDALEELLEEAQTKVRS